MHFSVLAVASQPAIPCGIPPTFPRILVLSIVSTFCASSHPPSHTTHLARGDGDEYVHDRPSCRDGRDERSGGVGAVGGGSDNVRGHWHDFGGSFAYILRKENVESSFVYYWFRRGFTFNCDFDPKHQRRR